MLEKILSSRGQTAILRLKMNLRFLESKKAPINMSVFELYPYAEC